MVSVIMVEMPDSQSGNMGSILGHPNLQDRYCTAGNLQGSSPCRDDKLVDRLTEKVAGVKPCYSPGTFKGDATIFTFVSALRGRSLCCYLC